MKNIQYTEQLDFQPQIHKNANKRMKGRNSVNTPARRRSGPVLKFQANKGRKATGFNYRNKETTPDVCPILGRECEIIFRIGPKKGLTICTKNLNKK